MSFPVPLRLRQPDHPACHLSPSSAARPSCTPCHHSPSSDSPAIRLAVSRYLMPPFFPALIVSTARSCLSAPRFSHTRQPSALPFQVTSRTPPDSGKLTPVNTHKFPLLVGVEIILYPAHDPGIFRDKRFAVPAVQNYHIGLFPWI